MNLLLDEGLSEDTLLDEGFRADIDTLCASEGSTIKREDLDT